MLLLIGQNKNLYSGFCIVIGSVCLLNALIVSQFGSVWERQLAAGIGSGLGCIAWVYLAVKAGPSTKPQLAYAILGVVIVGLLVSLLFQDRFAGGDYYHIQGGFPFKWATLIYSENITDGRAGIQWPRLVVDTIFWQSIGAIGAALRNLLATPKQHVWGSHDLG